MNRLILFLLFLYITYTESTLTSLNEMKATITPEMDTMIERILSGTERETFRIPSTCDGCNWYRIEMNAIYQKIDELNVFPDFSYEADMGTEPLYNNDTKGIVTIEDTESNGVRRIILQIDPTVVAAESIYYSLIIKNKEREKLDEEFKLNYVVKFSNAKTKEELAVLEFDDTIKMEKKESKVNVSFLFVPFLALHL